MRPIITFVIPVRHQDNASDWAGLKRRLTETMASIAAQRCANWQAVVVANHGADLPDLPQGFVVERVSFAANQRYDLTEHDREKAYDSFRLDKGRRVLAGMLACRDTQYFMIVDDDDFVSANLVDYVSRHIGENGWVVERGWLWSEGGRLVLRYDDFHHYCGTSLIIRSDLYQLPEHFDDASQDYMKSYLGSHIRISGILTEQGAPLDVLPFPGAVYRIGHSGAHSQSVGLLRGHVLKRTFLRHPRAFLRILCRLRVVGQSFKHEFFGAQLLG